MILYKICMHKFFNSTRKRSGSTLSHSRHRMVLSEFPGEILAFRSPAEEFSQNILVSSTGQKGLTNISCIELLKTYY